MSLIVLIGAHASGKMTVGKELEKRVDGKLLFNHQTIDIFANYLGYNAHTFRLSDLMRKELFKAFVTNHGQNETNSIIFTVVVNYDEPEDMAFLNEIAAIFQQENETVYFVELITSLEERLKRNQHPDRLAAKPSKRDLDFSENELKTTFETARLESYPGELQELFPSVRSLRIFNTELTPDEVCDKILAELLLE